MVRFVLHSLVLLAVVHLRPVRLLFDRPLAISGFSPKYGFLPFDD